MNATDRFTTDAPLDQMLSAFFKAELPRPFPPLKLLAASSNLPMPVARKLPAEDRHSSAAKSRMSLAVSVAMLVGGCWYISSQIGQPADRPPAGKGELSAKLPKELRKAHQDANKNPAMP